MGRSKLRLSMRALQVAFSTLRPSVGAVCLQLAKTDSFRSGDLFDTLYLKNTSSSSTSMYFNSRTNSPSSPSTTLQFSNPESQEKFISEEVQAVQLPEVSTRFFFTPSSTSSIVGKLQEENSTTDQKTSGCACEGSVAVSVCSENPYIDFRESMEEMVITHQMNDWQKMHELLQCYLKLNDRETHKIIVMAFVDLLLTLNMSHHQDKKKKKKDNNNNNVTCKFDGDDDDEDKVCW